MTRKSSGKNILATVCNVVGTFLLVAVVLVYLPLVLPRLAGYEVYKVVSGSMEPAIPTHSVVYVQPCDAAALKAGEVVAYRRDTALPVVHRVQANDTATQTLTTAGDANAQADPMPVPYAHVVGRVGFHLPLLGYAADLTATNAGRFAALGCILAAALLRLIAPLFRQ